MLGEARLQVQKSHFCTPRPSAGRVIVSYFPDDSPPAIFWQNLQFCNFSLPGGDLIYMYCCNACLVRVCVQRNCSEVDRSRGAEISSLSGQNLFCPKRNFNFQEPDSPFVEVLAPPSHIFSPSLPLFSQARQHHRNHGKQQQQVSLIGSGVPLWHAGLSLSARVRVFVFRAQLLERQRGVPRGCFFLVFPRRPRLIPPRRGACSRPPSSLSTCRCMRALSRAWLWRYVYLFSSLLAWLVR